MQQSLTDIQAASEAINTGLGAAIDACGKLGLDVTAATSTTGMSAESLFSRISTLTAGA
jgi:hypothetical protein